MRKKSVSILSEFNIYLFDESFIIMGFGTRTVLAGAV